MDENLLSLPKRHPVPERKELSQDDIHQSLGPLPRPRFKDLGGDRADKLPPVWLMTVALSRSSVRILSILGIRGRFRCWLMGPWTESLTLLGQISDFKLYCKELWVPLEIPQDCVRVKAELWMKYQPSSPAPSDGASAVFSLFKTLC